MNSPAARPRKGLHDFLASIKLSIAVLIALAGTSIFGTVIQQAKPAEVYVREYGAGVARVIQVLELGDMYHSWWFQVLLGLLLINITVCSLKRLPQAVRLMKDRDPVFDGRPVALHEKWQTVVKGRSVPEVVAAVESVLGGRLRRPVRAEVGGQVYLFASRGNWTRMGVYITHGSLFLFALGGIIGAQFGYKGFVNIPEGEAVSQVALRGGGELDLGFQVRCDRFEVHFYPDAAGRPTGRPREYLSDLTVIDGGQEVLKQRIEVNSPLIYKGIYFYQSSYGQAGGQGAWLSVFGARRNQIALRQRVDRGGQVELEDGARLVLRNLTGDFQGMGPAVEVAVEQPGQAAESGVVFQAPQGNNRAVGNYVVRLEGVDSVMYTGLQVARDPGVPVVWAGCLLITAGCLVAFFFSHRRVWARVQPSGGGVEVFLGGNASRNRISFEKWFAGLCESAQESFEK
ncbi:MAG: cytochrome c biogenesis protein ResB [Deferrisomatales bacterium]